MTIVICFSSRQLPLGDTKEPLFYWQHFQNLPSLCCDSNLWPSNHELAFPISRLQTIQSGPHCEPQDLWINIDTTSQGAVCARIDRNNMRQLLVDSVLRRHSRRSWTAAFRKHFLNLGLIWFCVYGGISVQGCYITNREQKWGFWEKPWQRCWRRLLCENTYASNQPESQSRAANRHPIPANWDTAVDLFTQMKFWYRAWSLTESFLCTQKGMNWNCFL